MARKPLTLGEVISYIEQATGTSIQDPAILSYNVVLNIGTAEQYAQDVAANGADNTITLIGD
jgi:hypothetical protein